MGCRKGWNLVPSLGVVRYADAPPFVMADIPGLIEGAHQGTGLGTRFLRHIERTRVLVHLIDISQITSDDLLRPYYQIENELTSYSEDLGLKKRVIVLNKTDLIENPESLREIAEAYGKTGYPVVLISALHRRGLEELLALLTLMLSQPGEPSSSL
jgi:GTP-binding protein